MVPEADDTTLVLAAQSGDGGALDTLLRRHYDRLYAVARRVVGNDADALDATQEALLAVVRGLDRFDRRSSFRTWSYRVATNAALDLLRRQRRRREDALPEDFAAPDPGATVEGSVTNRLAIDAALAQLAPDFRTAVVLRDLEGLDYAEIADVLQVPIGTVRSRIARGRAHLAELMAGNPDPASRRPTHER